MRNMMLMILITILYACNNRSQEPVLYMQSEDVQLVNPRIKAEHVIIDSISKITASLALDEAKIYYTNDGNVPTEASQEYKDTILVSNPGTYIFKAFHPDFKASEIEKVTVYNKGIEVDTISFNTSLHEQYPGEGEVTLVNHKKGTLDFRDGQWIGVTEPLEAIVTFKKAISLASIDIGYLVNTSAWIFPIQDISIAVSEDEVNFIDIDSSVDFEEVKAHVSKQGNVHIPVSKQVKKIRIKIFNTQSIPQWHDGKGTPAWLFMDEWIFNAKNN